MAMQDLHLRKQQEIILEKEKKKEGDRTRLFPNGYGRHLTDAAFREARRDQVMEKEASAAKKIQKAQEREAGRLRKQKMTEAWKIENEQYEKERRRSLRCE